MEILMNTNEYIEKRIGEEIKKFGRLANYYKYFYYILLFVKIVLPAVIWTIGTIQLNVVLLCAPVLFMPELNKTIDRLIIQYRIYDRWIIYSQAKETLIREKFLAEARAENYKSLDDQDTFIQMVEQTESILYETNLKLYASGMQKGILKDAKTK